MAPSHLSELRLSIFGVTTLVIGFLIFVANNNTWTSNKKSAVYISRVKTKAPYLSEILNKKDVDKNNQNKKLSSPWPNKVYNKWVNRSGIEYETYFDTGECKDAYRLPKDIKKLLHTRDFPLFMAERTKFTVEGFLKEFTHARPWEYNTMFDWVLKHGEFLSKTTENPVRILSDTSKESLAVIQNAAICGQPCQVDTNNLLFNNRHECRKFTNSQRHIKVVECGPPILKNKVYECKDESWNLCTPDLKQHRGRSLVIAQADDHNSGWQTVKGGFFNTNCCDKSFRKKHKKAYQDMKCFCQRGPTQMPLQLQELVNSNFFASIAYEAMDEEMEGIRPAPIPFTHSYSLSTNGTAGSSLTKLSARARLDKGKEFGILAAWGKAWPFLDKIVESRIQAIEWLESPQTLANRTMIPWEKYHDVLSSHKFMLSPTGGGIQSPKAWEAILLLTIPIVQRPHAAAYAALREVGFPLAVVDSWDEVTEDKLELWWDELSPHLDRARWMFLRDIWFAYVTHPCPILNIENFLEYLEKEID
eukprot:m.75712 g.75712  ORF g.75712 m.75712 type:complete len:531 (-) comp12519_c0_seq3:27-1619(-)